MNVVIIDDDKLVALSLKTILEADPRVEVLGIGNSGAEAIELYEQYAPEILLMDIRMEGMTGLEAGQEILTKHPDAKILFLTTFSDDEYIVKALHMGAKGYLLKQNFESIIPALLAVSGGQTVFGDEITEKLPNLLHTETPSLDLTKYGITEKEMDIIHQVAEGLNNQHHPSNGWFALRL